MKRILAAALCLILLAAMNAALAEEWICPECDRTGEGNFCPWCGTKKPDGGEGEAGTSAGGAGPFGSYEPAGFMEWLWGKQADGSAAALKPAGDAEVYCTPYGKFYHMRPDCCAMTGAESRKLSEVVESYRPCPVCRAPGRELLEETCLWADANGVCHTTDACADFRGRWSLVSLEDAQALGIPACPVCGANIYLPASALPAAQLTYTAFSMGDSGEEVLRMQDRLYELGFLYSDCDGEFDADTTVAVKLFQQAAGLPVTGVADSETLARLYADDAPRVE